MSLLRTFIAVEIPAEIQAGIDRHIRVMQNSLAHVVRWVPAHNLHLTLKFLGDISTTGLESLQQALTAEAGRFTPFEMQVGTLGCYPKPRRPRVIWIGIRAPAELESLQRAIDSATARLGYPAEERGFSPHLTIGRVRQNASAADIQKIRLAVDATPIGAIGTVMVAGVNLFRSELRPAGPLYTLLSRASFRN